MSDRVSLLAAAAKASITPPLDQSRRGGPDGLATSVVDELYARATVLSDGQTVVAVVLLDVCEFQVDITRAIRHHVATWTDIPPGAVMVCATHTHAGPRLLVDEECTPGASPRPETVAYSDYLARRAASTVVMAWRSLTPACLRLGEAPVPGVGVPSRVRLRDGTIVSLGSTLGMADIAPARVESLSPYDDTLRVALFERTDGTPICALACFGCHNNLALFSTGINPDFYGWAMTRAESDAGSGFVCSILAGSVGDVQPLACLPHRQYDEARRAILPPGRGDDLVPDAGAKLYAGLLAAWKRAQGTSGVPVGAAGVMLRLPLRQDRTRILDEFILNRRVAGGGMDDGAALSELQLLRLGDLGLIGLPGEACNEVAAGVRATSSCVHTWPISLANDRLGYLLPDWEHRVEARGHADPTTQYTYCLLDETAERVLLDGCRRLFSSP